MPQEAPEPLDPQPPAAPHLQNVVSGLPTILEPQPAVDDRAVTVDLIQQVETLRRSRVLVYWTSPIAKMSEGSISSFYDQLCAIGDTKHLSLILHTGGGDTEIPWRMVSLIREFAKRFSVIVPHRAASSGTLLAMGADEIVMTRFAVLGPIDPSRGHPLLPHQDGETADPVSVQDMRHAMQFIREAGRANGEFDYTPEAMAQIFTALFDKLHPLAIGAIEQAYALAKLIGTRCLETHMTGEGSEEKIARIVDKLCDGYKSHAYQIPRREAKGIGLKVKYAPKELDDLVMTLYRHYAARPMVPPVVPGPGATFRSHIAWLDSTAAQLRCVADQQISDDGKAQPKGDRWLPY